MLFELILAMGAGIIAGTFTGLAPGIHINLVAAFLTSSLTILAFAPPLALAAFIIAMAITHTFIDFIPSIYLGAPDEETFLSVLPGHELLRQGRGHEAVLLTLCGCACGAIILLLISPFFYFIAPILQQKLYLFLPFILIFITSYIIFREDRWLPAIIVFVLAGFLGYATLNLPINQPLLPLLTGLFGVSSLVLSIKDKTSLEKQEITSLRDLVLPKKEIKNVFLGTLLVSPFFSFLPALGAGYSTLIASEIWDNSRKGFLVLIGAMNTLVMGASFILVYSISKARTGAAAALKEIIPKITFSETIILVLVIIISSIVSLILGIIISKICAKHISLVPYQKLSLVVIVLLCALVLAFSHLLGLIVLITSAALGIFAIQSKIKRTHLMGCLLVPTIIYYLA